MKTMIALPHGYASQDRRYPALYLLHGWNGDYKNWITLTNLIAYSERYPMMIVMPDAENSWYVNSAADRNFADYIIEDLISEIDSRYRTITAPHRRAIAGLSMGGYGAMRFALKHPNVFAVAGSISGAFSGPSGIEQVMPEVSESVDIAFGPGNSSLRNDNDLAQLLKKAEPSALPYLFLTCGSQDPLLSCNRSFVSALSSMQLPYEYHESPGAHTWEFWDSSLPRLLEAVASKVMA